MLITVELGMAIVCFQCPNQNLSSVDRYANSAELGRHAEAARWRVQVWRCPAVGRRRHGTAREAPGEADRQQQQDQGQQADDTGADRSAEHRHGEGGVHDCARRRLPVAPDAAFDRCAAQEPADSSTDSMIGQPATLP